MEEILRETLEQLLNLMHIKFNKVDVEERRDHDYRINIDTDQANHLIGAHGNTLLSLQHLLKILIRKKTETDFSLSLDVDNYRKRQEDNVITMTEQKVEEVRKSGKKLKLPPMSSYFRRLVHLHLTKPEFSDVVTSSEGEGHYRAVVINPECENEIDLEATRFESA